VAKFIDNNDYNITMRYPLKAPVPGGESFLGDDATGETGRTDYLKIRRQRTTYRNGNYYGGNTDFLPDSTPNKSSHRSSVYISIPAGMNTQYQPVYRQVNLGIGGAAAIGAFGADNYQSLATALQQAASAIQPEFIASALSQGANAVSGFFGVQGQLDANVLNGLSTGKVFNPYTEQLFNQMNFRNHSFQIKMLARNYKEAKEINDIIKYIKLGAHPKVTSGDAKALIKAVNPVEGAPGTLTKDAKKSEAQKGAKSGLETILNSDKVNSAGRFFEIPDHYDLEYVRIDPDSVESSSAAQESQKLHYKMTSCVCSGISINYTPDNQYTSFKNVVGGMIQVPAIILNLQFTEVKLLNQFDIKNGF
tara:strand:+ start:1303 stop:2391 length:1089 start_codon:yes stop_codon:yes gene_type:complete